MKSVRAISRAQGLRRWTGWLRGRLATPRVHVTGLGPLGSGAQWRIDFFFGWTAFLRVSEGMLVADEEEFEAITAALEGHAWVGALIVAGSEGLDLWTWVES